jgi:hypothetical protein
VREKEQGISTVKSCTYGNLLEFYAFNTARVGQVFVMIRRLPSLCDCSFKSSKFDIDGYVVMATFVSGLVWHLYASNCKTWLRIKSEYSSDFIVAFDSILVIS